MLTVRQYQDADWAAVCGVHDRARPDELRGSCDPRAFVPIERDSEVAQLRRSHKHVACLADRVVGFVGCEGHYLGWLYVDPAHYRQGIGRALLRFAIESIGSAVWTIVLAGNTGALRLYEAEGFEVVSRFEGDNGGYPCECLRLELKKGPPSEAVR